MNDVNVDALKQRLSKVNFPRSSKYDPMWLMSNVMGPHSLWLAEWLSQDMEFRPGMRVLDLGCGRAVSSIFLAQEFGVTVWAADLWVKPADNLKRIEKAGCLASVYPIYAEAHSLPFAPGSFDAIVSFDAYHYFGTDDLYLGYLSDFLKPDGTLGIVSPCTLEELLEVPPQHLAPYWEWEFCSFHSADWWRRHWAKTGLVDVLTANTLHEGWKLWLEWNELCETWGSQGCTELVRREAEMLVKDDGRTLGFVRMIAQRKSANVP